MESMDTVSLQAVTLADGSTAYIQHDSKGSFSDGQIMDGQVIQLEDGSAAYVQHVSMPKAGKTQMALSWGRDDSIGVILCCLASSNLFVIHLDGIVMSCRTESIHKVSCSQVEVTFGEVLLFFRCRRRQFTA